MARGRRTKLTPDVQKKIVDALTAGNYFEVACAYAGISADTGFDWMQRGRGEHPSRKADPIYVQFVQAIEKAQADDEVHTTGRIKRAGHGGDLIYEKRVEFPDGRVTIERKFSEPQWTADAWRMERKHARRWGRKDKILNYNIDIDEQYEKLAKDYGLTKEEILAEAQNILDEESSRA